MDFFQPPEKLSSRPNLDHNHMDFKGNYNSELNSNVRITIVPKEMYDMGRFSEPDFFHYNYPFFYALHACEIRWPKRQFMAKL